MTTLSHLPVGCPSVITAIQAQDEGFLHRLNILGFRIGSPVEVLHYGFPFRNPVAVRVGAHTIALGREEASLIEVQECAHEA